MTIKGGKGGHIEKGKYTGLRNRNFFYRLFNRYIVDLMDFLWTRPSPNWHDYSDSLTGILEKSFTDGFRAVSSSISLITRSHSRSTTHFNPVFATFRSSFPPLFSHSVFSAFFARPDVKANVFRWCYSRWRRNRETITCSVGIYHVVEKVVRFSLKL